MENSPVKIWMADDDRDDLELMEEFILQQSPAIEVSTFGDGHSVLEYLNASSDKDLPCLIVLDYNMPDLSGAEVLAHLKDQQRFIAIPKIIVSTSDAPLNITECLDKGATEYFVKPATLTGLQNLAKKLISFCTPVIS
jgi:CheY-like chemotaxis protein